jgi:hypothetical protein
LPNHNHAHSDAFDLMLKAKARAEELSDDQRQRLDSHLSECSDCSAQHDALSEAVSDIRTSSFSITASPNLVRTTQLRVRARAWELRQQKNTMRPLSLSCLLAFAWALVSMPFLWQGFEWLGRANKLPDVLWQTGFVIMALMPIAAVGTIALASGLQGKFQKRSM